jgi:hypothetical protein
LPESNDAAALWWQDRAAGAKSWLVRIAVTILPFSTLPLPYVDEEGGDEGEGEGEGKGKAGDEGEGEGGGDEGEGEGEGGDEGLRKRWFIIIWKFSIVLSGQQQ